MPLVKKSTIIKQEVPDIFISYSRKDKEKAGLLHELLVKEGWEVWKDDRINAGQEFEEKINENLNLAKVMIVLWSKNSVASEWVIRECQIAVEQKKLKPVLLDECLIPGEFSRIEAAILTKWNGEPEHEELAILYRGISDSVIPSRLENVRKGYDMGFLGIKIKLPQVKGTADLLHYANFSIVMNPARRMAWYVAYNANWDESRENLPRGTQWMPDPSWPESLQPSDAHFRASGWNRGHLLSPMTVAWGNERVARIARRQANYWTNTTPQSQAMNTLWWLAVENLERQIAMKMQKITGFSGPVFKDDDKSFRDEFEKDGMFLATETYKVPNAYWKLVIFKDKRKLKYAAFVIDQSQLEGRKTIDLISHRVTIKELQIITGLKFPDTAAVGEAATDKLIHTLATQNSKNQ